MTVDAVTPNRSYPLPNAENTTAHDVVRLIVALGMLDIDVQAALAATAGYAPLENPAFSGVPTAPTATPGTDTTQVATTAFVEAALAGVSGAMSFKGNWDASSGSFPGSGAAQTGWYYVVSVAGTVDGVEFAVNDAIISKIDNAATNTYTGNWVKRDATDAVQSVAGLVGTISAAALKTALAIAIADIVGLQAALDGKSATTHVHTGVYEPANADLIKRNLAAVLTKGFPNTPYNLGSLNAGTITPDIASGHDQYGTLNGATKVAAPAAYGDVSIVFTNGASAASLDLTDFNVDGDGYDTTSGNKFLFYIKRGFGMAHLTIKADAGNA